jgi:hypothetical protein
MALNGSGPISLAGATAGQSIALELNLSATGTISLNQANVRTLANVPSGAIIMPTNFYGKSNRVTVAATISANTNNYVVNTAKASGYAAGTTDFTLTINSGIFVGSGSTGSYAMTVDTSWTAGDTVTIINNGTIVGRGGNGGQSVSPISGSGSGGAPGGPALNVNRAITLNNTNGRIAGGGGGGGGGGWGIIYFGKSGAFATGGGGGGGIGVSSGGAGGLANAGTGGTGGSGTFTAAGSGGAPGNTGATAGGNGGGYGSAGSAGAPGNDSTGGGPAGAAIIGNVNITYAGTGLRNGSIS